MATKRLPMRQIREILRLKYEQQLSHRAIAGACRVSLGTVSEYLGRSRRAGLASPRLPWTAPLNAGMKMRSIVIAATKITAQT